MTCLFGPPPLRSCPRELEKLQETAIQNFRHWYFAKCCHFGPLQKSTLSGTPPKQNPIESSNKIKWWLKSWMSVLFPLNLPPTFTLTPCCAHGLVVAPEGGDLSLEPLGLVTKPVGLADSTFINNLFPVLRLIVAPHLFIVSAKVAIDWVQPNWEPWSQAKWIALRSIWNMTVHLL